MSAEERTLPSRSDSAETAPDINVPAAAGPGDAAAAAAAAAEGSSKDGKPADGVRSVTFAADAATDSKAAEAVEEGEQQGRWLTDEKRAVIDEQYSDEMFDDLYGPGALLVAA